MSWKDNLLDASFRGVPFFVENHTLSGGRREVNHEFPDRDTPFSEDMGRKSKSFQISGHIIGDDYFLIRNRLLSAFDQFGPGELVHPYYGKLNVQASSYSFSEDTLEGRIVKFSVTFKEAGDFVFPSELTDREGVLGGYVTDAIDFVKDNFGFVFDVTNQPGFVVSDALGTVESLTDELTSATRLIQKSANGPNLLALKIRDLQNDITDLINFPSLLADRLVDAISSFDFIGADSSENIKAFSYIQNFGADLSPIPDFDTTSRDVQRFNRQAITDLVKTVSVVKQAQQALNAGFLSIDEADEERVRISDLIEREQLSTGSDDIYNSLRDINAILVKSLPDEDADLPNIQSYTPPTTVASLVLSYDLYESLDNEQDIVLRNNIEHPGYIPGGKPLEVLSA